MSSNIDVKCKCGREFTTTLSRFCRNGKTKCDVCSGHHYDTRYIRDYLKKLGAVLITEEYKNTQQKLLVKCECGEEFQTTFVTIRGKGKVHCNKCTIGRESTRLSEQEVVEFLKSKKLELLSPYEGWDSKLLLRCRCGNTFESKWNCVKSANRFLCKKCVKSSSKVEILAEEYLAGKGVNFATQFRFSDLKVKANIYLRYDIALLNDDCKPIALIELDGEHHYVPVKAWGGESALKRRTELDEMKTDYCEQRELPLFRIPYWKFNKIHEELEKILDMAILSQAS